MLSKREKIIAIVMTVVLCALIGDRYMLTPMLNKLNDWSQQSQELAAKVSEANSLLKQRDAMERKWEKMVGNELAADINSESRVLHALNQWSKDAGLTLNSVKPDRLTKIKGSLYALSFSVSGSGSLHATTEFMWHIEKATLPLRIQNLQLGSANESGIEMSIQLNISALTIIEDGNDGSKDA